MRLKILMGSTTMSSQIEQSTESSPPKVEPMPEVLQSFTEEDKWIHPKHWKMHAESADALEPVVKDLRDALTNLEDLRKKIDG